MYRYIFITLLIIGTLISCQKDEIVFIPNQESIINQRIFLSDLGIKPNSSTIEVTEGKSVYDLSQEWKIIIPSGSLINDSGKAYSGALRIEFLSISDNDLNLLQVPNTWLGQDPLAVNKMFYYKLNLEEKGLSISQPIFLLKSDTKPNDDDDSILSYNSKTETWENAGEQIKFNYGQWSIPDNEGTKEIVGFNIPVLSNELWIASTKSNSTKQYYDNSINIQLPSQFSSRNTICLLISLESKEVLKLIGNKDRSTFAINNYKFMGGSKYKVISMSELGDGKYYFGMTNVIESKTSYLMENKSVTKEELIKLLSEL